MLEGDLAARGGVPLVPRHEVDEHEGRVVAGVGGKAGRIADTRASHAKALQSASIEGLTIHPVERVEEAISLVRSLM